MRVNISPINNSVFWEMFEHFQLLGTMERKIVLQTRMGNAIENAQPAKPSEQDIKKFDLILAQHDWTLRKPACGIYNCFGHVWATRRTGIFDQQGITTILNDDGYRKLDDGERPSHGDVALYFSPPPESEIWHAGVVCELREFHNLDIAPVPWVLSKLNSVCGEVLHAAHDVHSPYGTAKRTVSSFGTIVLGDETR